jgi:ATP-dependent RNA helicase DeaD
VRQTAYIVRAPQDGGARPRARRRAAHGAIVFCRTRTEVDELTETLNGRGYRAEALHGGLSQEQRDRVMKKFRANTRDLLIATDVAARGLDVEHVSHVVNYDVPSAPETTSTASAARGAPGARASRSRSPSRASTACCATSSG